MKPTTTIRRTLALALAALGLATVGAATPASAHPDDAPGVHVTDRDAARRYVRADSDRDGRIERDELQHYWRNQAARGQLGDLAVDEETIAARVGATFDRDHDGRLTGRERRAFHRMIHLVRELDRLDVNRSGRLNPDEAAGSRFFAPRMARLDADRNGRVQADELIDAMTRAYARGDRAFARRFGTGRGRGMDHPTTQSSW
jgi:hypothetical protein